jgi:hypothetical protein
MNRVYLQIWEESDRNSGIYPDGCSLHLTISDRDNYIKTIYSVRDIKVIPNIYERIVGDALEAEVSDVLFSIITRNKSIRLMEHEMNNMLNMNGIIVNQTSLSL